MSADIYLTDMQYLEILCRLYNEIKNGSELVATDSNTIGDKYTLCSWGLCIGDPNFWKKDELMFPDHGPINGHESSKYTVRDRHFCPQDSRISFPDPTDTDDNFLNGCFWKCRIFKKIGDSSREMTLRRLEALQEYARQLLGESDQEI